MRLGTVIGKVTLGTCDPALRGGRFLLVAPWTRARFAATAATPAAAVPLTASVVVWDDLGAAPGHLIGFTEGAEASAPFVTPTPVDAFCAALIDEVRYTPPPAP